MEIPVSRKNISTKDWIHKCKSIRRVFNKVKTGEGKEMRAILYPISRLCKLANADPDRLIELTGEQLTELVDLYRKRYSTLDVKRLNYEIEILKLFLTLNGFCYGFCITTIFFVRKKELKEKWKHFGGYYHAIDKWRDKVRYGKLWSMP